MTLRTTTIDATLADVFGYPDFRPHQRGIIEHIVAGGDVFVLTPAGVSKSLCFQVPALRRNGTTVVVSPLIAYRPRASAANAPEAAEPEVVHRQRNARSIGEHPRAEPSACSAR